MSKFFTCRGQSLQFRLALALHHETMRGPTKQVCCACYACAARRANKFPFSPGANLGGCGLLQNARKSIFEIMGQAGVRPAMYPNGAKMALGWPTAIPLRKHRTHRQQRAQIDAHLVHQMAEGQYWNGRQQLQSGMPQLLLPTTAHSQVRHRIIPPKQRSETHQSHTVTIHRLGHAFHKRGA